MGNLKEACSGTHPIAKLRASGDETRRGPMGGKLIRHVRRGAPVCWIAVVGVIVAPPPVAGYDARL